MKKRIFYRVLVFGGACFLCLILFWNYFFQALPSSKESLNTDHWYHLYATYAPLELILEKFRVIQMSLAFFIFENNIF